MLYCWTCVVVSRDVSCTFEQQVKWKQVFRAVFNESWSRFHWSVFKLYDKVDYIAYSPVSIIIWFYVVIQYMHTFIDIIAASFSVAASFQCETWDKYEQTKSMDTFFPNRMSNHKWDRSSQDAILSATNDSSKPWNTSPVPDGLRICSAGKYHDPNKVACTSDWRWILMQAINLNNHWNHIKWCMHRELG